MPEILDITPATNTINTPNPIVPPLPPQGKVKIYIVHSEEEGNRYSIKAYRSKAEAREHIRKAREYDRAWGEKHNWARYPINGEPLENPYNPDAYYLCDDYRIEEVELA